MIKAKEDGDFTRDMAEFGVGMCRLSKVGFMHMNATRINGIDGTNAENLTKAEIQGMKQIREFFLCLKKYMPGFSNVFINKIGSQCGIRETRRIDSKHFLILDEIKAGEEFDDKILKWRWGHANVHSGKDNRWEIEIVEGPYCIPFRCLLPKNCENLLVAGRCIGTDRKVNGTIRSQPIAMSTGQVAGAAAICVKKQQNLKELDIQILRSELEKQNIKL